MRELATSAVQVRVYAALLDAYLASQLAANQLTSNPFREILREVSAQADELLALIDGDDVT
jgi:hypothetical protein